MTSVINAKLLKQPLKFGVRITFSSEMYLLKVSDHMRCDIVDLF